MQKKKYYSQGLKEVSKRLELLALDKIDEDVTLLKEAFDITYDKNIFSLY